MQPAQPTQHPEQTSDAAGVLGCSLQDFLEKHEKTNEETKVRFMDFGPSSLDVMVLYYIKNPEWNEFVNIKQEINFEIMNIVAKHKSDFAFPTTTVNIQKQD